jgi:protein TonB
MPRDLFGDVTSPSIRLGSRRWYTVPLSLMAHTSGVLVAVIVPLMAAGTLPDPRSALRYVPIDPGPAALPPPPSPATPPPRPAGNPDVAPIEAPAGIAPEPEFEPIETAFVPAPELPGVGIIDGAEPIAPPPFVDVAPTPAPVRVGGHVRPPEKVRDAAPLYPAIAQAARVEGVVVIEATIGVDGRVEQARVLRSVPLLDQAALAAVQEWTYTPTTLNGVPVPVIMTVTVHFKLQ